MPRQARIDAPGALYHIVIRGIERRGIFQDDEDRKDFLERLSGLLQEVDRSAVSRAVQRVEKDPDLIAAARRILGLLVSHTSHH
jgi:REP element-mobilizing transposase RayT